MAISPDEDDVLLMNAASILSQDTFRVEVLRNRFNILFEHQWGQWLDGLPCKLLSPKNGGWQKGTIRMVIKVSFEFTPDENEV